MAGSKTVEKSSKKAAEAAEVDERESTQEEESVENQDIEVLQSLGIVSHLIVFFNFITDTFFSSSPTELSGHQETQGNRHLNSPWHPTDD